LEVELVEYTEYGIFPEGFGNSQDAEMSEVGHDGFRLVAEDIRDVGLFFHIVVAAAHDTSGVLIARAFSPDIAMGVGQTDLEVGWVLMVFEHLEFERSFLLDHERAGIPGIADGVEFALEGFVSDGLCGGSVPEVQDGGVAEDVAELVELVAAHGDVAPSVQDELGEGEVAEGSVGDKLIIWIGKDHKHTLIYDMLKLNRSRTRDEWVKVFSQASVGHILWDGWAKDPYNPVHAYTGAHQFVKHAATFGFFRNGNRILDLGCGNGRLGIALSEMPVEYVGIDPSRGSIDFCSTAFAGYERMVFLYADIWNEVFNPTGAVRPEEYRIPYPDGYFDDVIAYSVFTHLQTVEAAWNYMNEIRRVLKVGGKFFSSWYRSPPNPATTDVGRTAYNEWDIMSMLHGFRFDHTYGGHSNQFYDQWAIFGELTR
jgi:SAM-dependent methyltransferase